MVRQKFEFSNRYAGPYRPNHNSAVPDIRCQCVLSLNLADLRCVRIYIFVIKMLNFCYTFWIQRGYLVISKEKWTQPDSQHQN